MRLATFLEKNDALVRKVKGAMIYPAVIMSVAAIAVVVSPWTTTTFRPARRLACSCEIATNGASGDDRRAGSPLDAHPRAEGDPYYPVPRPENAATASSSSVTAAWWPSYTAAARTGRSRACSRTTPSSALRFGTTCAQ